MEFENSPTLRILTSPMETPDPPSDTPGASKKVFLTPHDIPKILRVKNENSASLSSRAPSSTFVSESEEKINDDVFLPRKSKINKMIVPNFGWLKFTIWKNRRLGENLIVLMVYTPPKAHTPWNITIFK